MPRAGDADPRIRAIYSTNLVQLRYGEPGSASIAWRPGVIAWDDRRAAWATTLEVLLQDARLTVVSTGVLERPFHHEAREFTAGTFAAFCQPARPTEWDDRRPPVIVLVNSKIESVRLDPDPTGAHATIEPADERDGDCTVNITMPRLRAANSGAALENTDDEYYHSAG